MSDFTLIPAEDSDPSNEITAATTHNTLAGRSTADAHPASAITTDNDWNGNLTSAGTNLAAVLDAIDDLALGGGGGAVDSVNGETGAVVLDAADVDAAPTSRTITAGTGLTGGGTLAADRTLAVSYGTTAGTAAQGNDSRLSDARTPTAHAASHAIGGADPLPAIQDPEATFPLVRHPDLRGLDAARSAATAAAPFEVIVLGDSQATGTNTAGVMTSDTLPPWPARLAHLLGAGGGDLFRPAKGDTGSVTMTGTTGTWVETGIGGQAASLDPGEYVYQTLAVATHIRVWWSAGTGTIQVRDGSAAGTLLATIDCTTGTTASNFTDLSVAGGQLPNVFGGIYFGNLYLVAAGAVGVVEALHFRNGSSLMVTNGSRAGYASNTFTAFPARGLDAITKSTPDLVLIATGTNDDIANIDTRMRALITAVQAASPTSVVALVIPPVSLSCTLADVEALRAICTDLDLASIDLAAHTGNVAVLPPVVGDLLHYTPAGHELVARLVQAGVKGDPASTAIGAGLTRADLASYTPTTPADWTVAPTQLRYALDELAARDAGIPATIIDAAGDLIVGTAADTAARLAVGTSGQVLTSNGTTATWATPSSTPAEVFIPAATLHGSTAVQSNWATYPTRAHAFHQLNDSATSTIGAMVGKSIPWTSVDIYAVVGNPTAGSGDVRWTLYYGKDAGTATTRSSVSTTTTLAAGGATYPTPQRVKVGNAIAWDTAGDWSLVLSRLGSDGADTLATAIFLQGLVIRQAGT